MKINFLILVTCSLLFTAFAQGFICPEPNVIAPCTCYTDKGGQGYCHGPDVTQETLNRMTKAFRDSNGIGPNDWMTMNEIVIYDTSLTHVDLTPFVKLNLENLIISYHSNLTSISGPGWPHQESINVTYLDAVFNALTNEGLGESLKHFGGLKLQKLDLNGNNILGSNGGLSQDDDSHFEFLPGLNLFQNLRDFTMSSNKVKKVRGGQLIQHNRLLQLDFGLTEEIEIGPNAFTFEKLDPTDPFLEIPMELSLGACDLYDLNNTENGLNNFQRPLLFVLVNNNLETLTQENFESILRAHEATRVYLEMNRFVCDERMKWLHDESHTFQHKVTGVDCVNDPGEDVFSTSLIQ